MQKTKYYTFMLNQGELKDGYVKISSDGSLDCRTAMVHLFDTEWAFEYDRVPREDTFELGCLIRGVITRGKITYYSMNIRGSELLNKQLNIKGEYNAD